MAGWRGTRPVECLLLVGIQREYAGPPGTRGRRTGGRGRIERIDSISEFEERYYQLIFITTLSTNTTTACAIFMISP
ncbi:hypothetical protein Agabi119p4_6111 [Agaricus bisporus var. burnettii]|uniref:Uncharacterized protein n=1 Tax=Agaricus bisporus var. burnettii TaxID=192524 RepID=A0A8H7F190_AGABI|nr:hypothetical protein Agabi119p4_6111 [Agaricus bisporus var. burnettii]